MLYAYSIARDRYSNHSRLSVCVCLSDITRKVAIFFNNFHDILHRDQGPKSKKAIVRGQNPTTRSLIWPQIFTSVMHFQQEVPNNTVTMPAWTDFGRQWLTGCDSEAATCPKLKNATTPYFAPETQNGDRCIFSGNTLG